MCRLVRWINLLTDLPIKIYSAYLLIRNSLTKILKRKQKYH